VVFDNADDLTLLAPFLPTSRKGHVLLTSRAHATGYLGPCVSLQTLTPQQGAMLLLGRAKLLQRGAFLENITEPIRADALRIAEVLGGLPLALDQAGAFIEETPSSPAEYLRLYEKEQVRLLTHRGGIVTKHHSVFVRSH
jgi:hypothetical protein